jgi:hypothetical protein
LRSFLVPGKIADSLLHACSNIVVFVILINGVAWVKNTREHEKDIQGPSS